MRPGSARRRGRRCARGGDLPVEDELDVPLVLGLGEVNYEMKREERKRMVRMASSGASWNDREERPELCGRRRASVGLDLNDGAAEKKLDKHMRTCAKTRARGED